MCNVTQKLMITTVAILLVTGCEQRRDTDTTSFEDGDCPLVLAIVVDLSGSCTELFADGGKGYDFLLGVLDKYQRAVPTEGKVIIAQLSAADNPLLYEGSPADLRRDYPSAAAFRDDVLSKSNPSGSRLHEGMNATFEYILKHRAVQQGARPAVFLLSDLLDNGIDGGDYEQQVVARLQDFGAKDGIAGFYFVDQSQTDKWTAALASAGVKDYRVTDKIVAHPPLPSFD